MTTPKYPTRRELVVGGVIGFAGCTGRRADGRVGVAGVENLRLEFATGSLRVVGTSDTGELVLRGIPVKTGILETVEALVDAIVDALSGAGDPDGVRVSHRGGTLHMTTGPRFADAAAKIELRVPRTIAVIGVETGDGDLILVGTRGDTVVRTNDGDVTVQGVTGFPTVETTDGDVLVRNTNGLAGATTSDGAVHVEIPAINGGTTVRSGAGPVTAVVPRRLPAVLDARSVDGRVTVPDGFLSRRKTDEPSHVEGPIVSAADQLLRVSSGDGLVEIQPL